MYKTFKKNVYSIMGIGFEGGPSCLKWCVSKCSEYL